MELGAYLASIFLAFGVGLDPRQGQVFGPALSPILVGSTVALCQLGTIVVKQGYYGACKLSFCSEYESSQSYSVRLELLPRAIAGTAGFYAPPYSLRLSFKP